MCVRRISLGGEGNALYPVLCSYYRLFFTGDTSLLDCDGVCDGNCVTRELDMACAADGMVVVVRDFDS